MKPSNPTSLVHSPNSSSFCNSAVLLPSSDRFPQYHARSSPLHFIFRPQETQNKTADSSSSSNVEATASSTAPGKDLPSASTVAACAAAAANQAIVGGAEVATVESEQCVEENGAECAEKTLQGIYINTHGSPLPSAIPTLTLSSATVSRQGSSAKSSKSANAGVAVQQLGAKLGLSLAPQKVNFSATPLQHQPTGGNEDITTTHPTVRFSRHRRRARP